jgi:hypothetical protein
MNQNIAAARPGEGFLIANLDKRPRQFLETSCKLSEEMFSAIEAFSEVKETGLQYLSERTRMSGVELEKLYELFQADVRQGRTFFTAAEQLHHRASPLMFYYSFLNLAKAYLRLAKPEASLDPQARTYRYHGLVAGIPQQDFSKETIEVNGGVFTSFYEALTGKSLPLPSGTGACRQCGFVLNISEMLGYSSDVCFDYASATGDKSRCSSGRSRIVMNQGVAGGWYMLAISNFDGPTKFPSAFTEFFEKFEEVSLDPPVAERMFGLMAEQRSEFRYFQSKATYKPNDAQSSKDFLANLDAVCHKYFSAHPFFDDNEFDVFTPLGPASEYPWSELLGGYAVFFYLGNLVRYHPHYLERLLEKKEAWLIQSFTKSTSLTLLRHFTMLLLNRAYVFRLR